jgi:hypothetical protein
MKSEKNHRRLYLVLVLIVCLNGFTVKDIFSEEKNTSENTTVVLSDPSFKTIEQEAINTIQKSQLLLQNRIQNIEYGLKQHAPSGQDNTFAEEQLDILGKIDFIYTQQISTLKTSGELDQEIEKLQAELTTAGQAESAEKSAPLSFIMLDMLQKNKILLQEDDLSIASGIRAEEALIQEAKENKAMCEKKTPSHKG